jgi:hypothetical protein
MGLFGGGNNDREEVHLGEPDEDEERQQNSEEKGNPADVGTIDFGSGDDSSSSRSSGSEESESKLRNEISSMESVETSSSGSSSGGSSHRVTSSTSGEPDLEEIKDQNQEIIDKLEKVLNRL